VGQTDTVYLMVRFCSAMTASFSNRAIAYGNSLPGGGLSGYDISASGLDADPNHNDNPSDPGEDGSTVFMPYLGFQIPQGFSPNGDGINDRFEIMGISEYPQLELSILNRWGNVVYNKKQYDNTWDGKATEGITFGNSDLPEGTYFYIIDLGNNQKPLKGFVYLNRSVR
jgi:gliding motility-associated-like protein